MIDPSVRKVEPETDGHLFAVDRKRLHTLHHLAQDRKESLNPRRLSHDVYADVDRAKTFEPPRNTAQETQAVLTESVTIVLLSVPHLVPAEAEGNVEVLELGLSEDEADILGYVESFGVSMAPIVMLAHV